MEFEEKVKVENERKSKAEMLTNTWALARLCQEIITESEGEWNDRTAEMESNIEKIKAANEKKVRLEIVKEKKAAIEMKRKQQRIDIMIDELSVKGVEEWTNIESEIEKKERLEIRNMKENIWRWRTSGNSVKKDQKAKKTEFEKVTNKYEKIKTILETERLEKRDRLKRKQKRKLNGAPGGKKRKEIRKI